MNYALLAGWIADLCLGDPSWLPHPVVGFGRWIAFNEKRLNRGSHRRLKGALLAVGSICMTYALTWLVLRLLSAVPWDGSDILAGAVSAVVIFFCLAGCTLRSEVRQVFVALERGLDDGRRQVARIVGRDTTQLTAHEVRTAALETLAENLSDGVIAPLFWLSLLGVPGMMAYKMANTLDSMIGYRNDRYRDFGCWAARTDDVLNFIPARLTAALIVLSGWIYGHCSTLFGLRTGAKVPKLTSLIRFVWRYGGCHASPNSGWPEAALAAVLSCQFGGTHMYFGQVVEKPYIGHNGRQLTTDDMHTSVRTCFVAELMAVIMAAAISWLL